MKRVRIEWILLIMFTFIFFGVDGILAVNAALVVKAVCIISVCVSVYKIIAKFEAAIENISEKNTKMCDKAMQGISEIIQREITTLASGQKKIEGQFAEYNQNEKILIESTLAEVSRQDAEREKRIEKYLEDLREEQQNILTESNGSLRSIVEKLLQSQTEQSQQLTSLLKDVAEKNVNMYEQSVRGIKEALRQENQNRNNYFEKLDQELSEKIQGLIDIQSKNMDTLTAAMNSNEVMYDKFVDEIRKMNEVQVELLSKEKEIRDMNEDMLQNINTAMNRFVQVSDTVKDEVSALKAYMKAFRDKLETRLDEHFENMESMIEDGNDESEEILNKSAKNQINALSDQTGALMGCIAQIEKVVNKTVQEVTERNDRLLLNLERMQDEWTNLNRSEIEFLNKIWEEQ